MAHIAPDWGRYTHETFKRMSWDTNQGNRDRLLEQHPKAFSVNYSFCVEAWVTSQ